MLRFMRTFFTNQPVVDRKLILIFAQEDNQLSQALADRIKRELRQVNLNAFKTEKLIYSSQVPYTVIITKETLKDGILKLQHHNPKQCEQVHVSDLPERLLLETNMLRCIETPTSTEQ